MGTTTNAILVWGFDLGAIENEKVEGRVEFLSDEGYDELEKLEKDIGVELVQHCSDGCENPQKGRWLLASWWG